MRRLGPFVVLLAAVALPSVAAQAAQVSLEPAVFCSGSCRYMNYEDATRLVVRAGSGEANAVRIERSGKAIAISDASAPVSAGKGCVNAGERSVACSLEGRAGFVGATVELGDGDDRLDVAGDLGGRLDGIGGETQYGGGPGDDRIVAGDGPEIVVGGPGSDELRAGEGDDSLPDEPGGGSDLIDGGPGNDNVDYAASTASVRVDLADLRRSNGESDERDALRGVEHVIGGPEDDVLLGGPADDVLDGAGGADIVDGRGGNDALIGSPGQDRIAGGPGNDRIASHDSSSDRIACGAGADRVGAILSYPIDAPIDEEAYGPDRTDLLAPDCELVLLVGYPDEYAERDLRPTLLDRATVSFANPCRRRGCRATISMSFGPPARRAARMRVKATGRRLRLRLTRAAQRALAADGRLRITVRVGLNTYRAAFAYELIAARRSVRRGGRGDQLRGGGGDDTLVANETPRAADTFDGGPGEDMLSYRDRMMIAVPPATAYP